MEIEMSSDFLNSPEPDPTVTEQSETQPPEPVQKEIGGRKEGLDPSRFGDWEKNGRCIDF
jgi:hypothetical protein